MNVHQLKQSKFLTRADVGKGMLVTINGDVFQENVAKEGAPEEMKWCISFHEAEKPMVLNSVNGQLIAQICKSEESENWNGHKIVLYDDPSVQFGGKLVGGIRVRAPRGAAAKASAPAQPASGINNPALRAAAASPKPVPTPAPIAAEPEPEPEPDPTGLGDDDVPF